MNRLCFTDIRMRKCISELNLENTPLSGQDGQRDRTGSNVASLLSSALFYIVVFAILSARDPVFWEL